MATLRKIISIALIVLFTIGCSDTKKSAESITTTPEPSVAAIKAELNSKGYQTFDYIDDKSGDTIIMQQYFVAFLKKGPNKSKSPE